MEYCTIENAAITLGVSRPTVYKFIKEQKLTRHTVLGRPALKISQVTRLAAQLKAKGSTNGTKA